jgi:hypothetical protein
LPVGVASKEKSFDKEYIEDYEFIPIDNLTDETNKYYILNSILISLPESNFIYSAKNKLFFGDKILQTNEKKLIKKSHFSKKNEENSKSLVQRI